MLFGRRLREVGGEESIIIERLWTGTVFDDDDDIRMQSWHRTTAQHTQSLSSFWLTTGETQVRNVPQNEFLHVNEESSMSYIRIFIYTFFITYNGM